MHRMSSVRVWLIRAGLAAGTPRTGLTDPHKTKHGLGVRAMALQQSEVSRGMFSVYGAVPCSDWTGELELLKR